MGEGPPLLQFGAEHLGPASG